MKEYELEVLEQYDMEVKSTRRIRGAFFCDTNEGTMLLKETKISARRAPLLYKLLSRLETEAGFQVDTPVFTKNGELLCAGRDGTKYMLKKWYAGRECEVKREADIIEAVRQLARIHRNLSWQRNFDDIEESFSFVGRLPEEEVKRHNRELRKVRAFIRNRVSKSDFEYLFLENFEKMYALAEKVTARLEGEECRKLFWESIEKRLLVHGDYNYHNVLMMAAGMPAVTNFEHFRMDIQAQDLYYFLRKVMEKHQWDVCLGRKMLEAYQAVRPLTVSEKEYIALNLAYPEKFWKTASSYYHSNKAWIPEKSVEKLRLSVLQAEKKLDFLEKIFQINI